MKVNINSIADLLDDKLTIKQRGLLITILLIKDIKPKFTLAKLKTLIKIKEYHQDLISLHEAKFITWSGYRSAKNAKAQELDNPKIEDVMSFMNGLLVRNFNPKSQATTKDLRVRLEDHSVEDIKKVIANRYAEWKDSEKMSKHLNPTTLFRASNFEKYLEEANRTKIGQGFVSANRMDLKGGDELLFSMNDNILDKDVYSIKTYDIDPKGNRISSGMASKVYGSTLKQMLKAENNKIQKGFVKEFLYIYKEN